MPWKKSEPMEQREEFVLRALRAENFRALCQEYGISAKTGYKWQKRFLRLGLGGMEEESRRPQSHAAQLGEAEVCAIIRLKMGHPRWGPRKIRELYLRQHGAVASESSFKRVLERAGLTEKGKRRRVVVEGGRLSSGRRAQAVNEIWTVDFKGWWKTKEGRCEPLTVRDEYSRYVLELRKLEDGRSQTVQRSFERLFERHGLPGAIRSDNGSPFASVQTLHGLSRLSAWWVALGIDLERGRVGCPQDNGAHERLHRDISLELEGLGEARQEGLDLWRQEFNYERPHEALQMRCPGEVYQNSTRSFAGTPQELIYPGTAARQVDKNGSLSWQNQKLFLSRSLAGWSVGLKNAGGQFIEVWFTHLLLGHIDQNNLSFLRADIPQKAEGVGGFLAAETA
jgi:transposase InsO family protein